MKFKFGVFERTLGLQFRQFTISSNLYKSMFDFYRKKSSSIMYFDYFLDFWEFFDFFLIWFFPIFILSTFRFFLMFFRFITFKFLSTFKFFFEKMSKILKTLKIKNRFCFWNRKSKIELPLENSANSVQ